MTHLVHLLMALIMIHFILRQSMLPVLVNIATAALTGLSLILLQPVITGQSKTHLEWLLTNPDTLTTLTLLVVFECIVVLAWCFANPSQAGKKAVFARFVKWFPGVTALPVIWYFLAMAIFEMPGVSFQNITLIMAAAVFGILTALPALIRSFLPATELRQELLFMLTIVLMLLSAIAPVQGTPVFSTTQDPQIISLLVFSGITAALFGAGVILSRLKKRPDPFARKRMPFGQKSVVGKKAA